MGIVILSVYFLSTEKMLVFNAFFRLIANLKVNVTQFIMYGSTVSLKGEENLH